MEPNKMFVIKHKATGELFRARSGKTSWKAPGHAKNAFNQSVYSWNYKELGLSLVKCRSEHTVSHVPYMEVPKFSEQDVYEIVELKIEAVSKLEEATQLLRECLGRCNYSINAKIEKFLEKVDNVL